MERSFDRVSVVVIDGVGCGQAADTFENYPEDIGANSLMRATARRKLDAYGLQFMGLEYVPGLEIMDVFRSVDRKKVRGAFGALEPTFAGNGSPEGHQALMGHIVRDPYLLFNKTRIPEEIVRLVEEVAAAVMGRQAKVIRYPKTDDINGVQFIHDENIGPVHLTSRNPNNPLYVPTYASSDSLVQIALHQEVVPQPKIEEIGKAVRKKLDESHHRVALVIMRPFVGEPGKFERVSADRRDYAMDPDEPTLIDYLTEAGIPVFGIGKAASMFNYRGFPEGRSKKFQTDEERIFEVLRRTQEEQNDGFVLANLVDTDEKFGHMRNSKGYVDHINAMAAAISEIQKAMRERDLLIVTSDHGNDPTYREHTNHTRERVPVLAFSPTMNGPIELGIRKTYADVAATIAENFGVQEKIVVGESFLSQLQAA